MRLQWELGAGRHIRENALGGADMTLQEVVVDVAEAIDETAHRLDELEASYRRNLKLLTLVGGVSILVLAILAITGLQSDPRIEADEIVIRDAGGRARMMLYVSEAEGDRGPRLVLMDEDGTTRTKLALNDAAFGLFLMDQNRKIRSQFAMGQSGPNMILTDTRGKARVQLHMDDFEKRLNVLFRDPYGDPFGTGLNASADQ
jgi:hypothetical protein